MINYINLDDFIAGGEDVCKEFKPNFRNHKSDISSTMVAFSNDLNWVGGGYIYIGIRHKLRDTAYQTACRYLFTVDVEAVFGIFTDVEHYHFFSIIL